MAEDAVTRRFAALRQRAVQDARINADQEQEALKRRFTSMGMGGSGEAVKQEQLARDAAAQRAEKAGMDVDLAEQAERQRLEEVQQGREFQVKEREASQSFGAQQAQLGREFQTGERLGSQQFGAQQSQLGREFASSERQAGQQFGSSEAEKQRGFASGERVAGQEFASGQRSAAESFQEKMNRGAQDFTREERKAGFDNAKDMARLAQGNALQLQKAEQNFRKVEAAADRDLQKKLQENMVNLEQQKINLSKDQFDEAKKQAILQMKMAVEAGVLEKVVAQYNMGFATTATRETYRDLLGNYADEVIGPMAAPPPAYKDLSNINLGSLGGRGGV